MRIPREEKLSATAPILVKAARLPVAFVKAILNHNDKGVTDIYARWHMFEEKREAVLAIEAAYSVRATNAYSPISEPRATTVIARKN